MHKSLILKEVQYETTRSRGPGGQHVNRTESAVILRWPVVSSTAISEEQKSLIFSKLRNLMNNAGELLFRSDEFRSQEDNRKSCEEKLWRALEKAFFKPKKRIATKPSRSSQRKRVAGKKIDAVKKQLRGRVRQHDD